MEILHLLKLKIKLMAQLSQLDPGPFRQDCLVKQDIQAILWLLCHVSEAGSRDLCLFLLVTTETQDSDRSHVIRDKVKGQLQLEQLPLMEEKVHM